MAKVTVKRVAPKAAGAPSARARVDAMFRHQCVNDLAFGRHAVGCQCHFITTTLGNCKTNACMAIANAAYSCRVSYDVEVVVDE